jgi:membrane-bound ClpP family serine protease
MRTSSKILFVAGIIMIVGGLFDPLYNGPDVIGMFTLLAAFISLGIDDV